MMKWRIGLLIINLFVLTFVVITEYKMHGIIAQEQAQLAVTKAACDGTRTLHASFLVWP